MGCGVVVEESRNWNEPPSSHLPELNEFDEAKKDLIEGQGLLL